MRCRRSAGSDMSVRQPLAYQRDASYSPAELQPSYAALPIWCTVPVAGSKTMRAPGKHVDSPYRPARSPAWIKMVLRRRIECVIGAWIPSRTAGSDHLGALLLGRLAPPRPGERRLRLDCVGAVGTGCSRSQGRRLLERLQPLATHPTRSAPKFPASTCPEPDGCSPSWCASPSTGAGPRPATYATPRTKGLLDDRDPTDADSAPRAGRQRHD